MSSSNDVIFEWCYHVFFSNIFYLCVHSTGHYPVSEDIWSIHKEWRCHLCDRPVSVSSTPTHSLERVWSDEGCYRGTTDSETNCVMDFCFCFAFSSKSICKQLMPRACCNADCACLVMAVWPCPLHCLMITVTSSLKLIIFLYTCNKNAKCTHLCIRSWILVLSPWRPSDLTFSSVVH